MVVSTGGCVPGRTTSDGCGVKVRTTLGTPRSRASATARPMIAACPRWTPSNTPMVTTQCPHPEGTESSPCQRSTNRRLLAGDLRYRAVTLDERRPLRRTQVLLHQRQDVA